MTVKAFIARLSAYLDDALCCCTFWLAEDFLSLDDTLTQDDINDVALLRIHAARRAGVSTARSQCAPTGWTRDGRLFRACPASL